MGQDVGVVCVALRRISRVNNTGLERIFRRDDIELLYTDKLQLLAIAYLSIRRGRFDALSGRNYVGLIRCNKGRLVVRKQLHLASSDLGRKWGWLGEGLERRIPAGIYHNSCSA